MRIARLVGLVFVLPLVGFACGDTVTIFGPAGSSGGAGGAGGVGTTGETVTVGPGTGGSTSQGTGGAPNGGAAPGGFGGDVSVGGSGQGGSSQGGSGQGGSSQGGSSQGGSSQGGMGQGGMGQGGSSQGGMGTGGTGQGGMGTGGMGGQGGGGNSCTHDICDTGPALVNGCDPCVTQICAVDPFCCNNNWDNICVSEVGSVCMIDCYPVGQGPCGMQYPTSPVCDDAMGQCQLAHNTTQSSCDSLCEAGGGECLGAFNDVNNQTCQVNPNAPYPCGSQQFTSVVCVCSQGCGSGPPCTSPQICVNGQCM